MGKRVIGKVEAYFTRSHQKSYRRWVPAPNLPENTLIDLKSFTTLYCRLQREPTFRFQSLSVDYDAGAKKKQKKVMQHIIYILRRLPCLGWLIGISDFLWPVRQLQENRGRKMTLQRQEEQRLLCGAWGHNGWGHNGWRHSGWGHNSWDSLSSRLPMAPLISMQMSCPKLCSLSARFSSALSSTLSRSVYNRKGPAAHRRSPRACCFGTNPARFGRIWQKTPKWCHFFFMVIKAAYTSGPNTRHQPHQAFQKMRFPVTLQRQGMLTWDRLPSSPLTITRLFLFEKPQPS